MDDEHSHVVYRRSFEDSLLPWEQQNKLCSDQGIVLFSDEGIALDLTPYSMLEPDLFQAFFQH